MEFLSAWKNPLRVKCRVVEICSDLMQTSFLSLDPNTEKLFFSRTVMGRTCPATIRVSVFMAKLRLKRDESGFVQYRFKAFVWLPICILVGSELKKKGKGWTYGKLRMWNLYLISG